MATKYKVDFYKAVSKRTGRSQAEIRRILYNMEEQIKEWTAKGHRVQLTGFGTFEREKDPVEFRAGTGFQRAMKKKQ